MCPHQQPRSWGQESMMLQATRTMSSNTTQIYQRRPIPWTMSSKSDQSPTLYLCRNKDLPHRSRRAMHKTTMGDGGRHVLRAQSISAKNAGKDSTENGTMFATLGVSDTSKGPEVKASRGQLRPAAPPSAPKRGASMHTLATTH